MRERLIAFTVTASATSWKTGRATHGKTSGKWYFEITLGTAITSGNAIIGLATASATLANYLTADAYSVGYTNSAQFKTPVNTVLSTYGTTAVTAGDTIRVALDLDFNKCWIGKIGDFWNGEPEDGYGGFSLPAGMVTGDPAIFPAYSLYASSNSLVANFGNDNFKGEIPEGFKAWDDE